MLILMCGLPSSGKSVIVDMVADIEPSVWVIRSEDWLPENIAELSGEEEKHHRIECWRMALNKAEESVEEYSPDDVVILDCGNSKFKPLQGLIRMAKRNEHKVAVLYANSRLVLCEERAGKQWIGEEIAKSYVESIKDSLPKFKHKCDQVVIVDNNSDLDGLKQNVLNAWGRLCQIT